jgi:sarcosine oxidase
VADNEVGYYEPGAGYVRPEACVRAQLMLAERHGAQLHRDETAEAFSQDGDAVTVTTSRGKYEARRLVVCAGAWLPRLLDADLARHFTVTRQVLYWFELRESPRRFAPPELPVWIWELQDRRNVIYGFPAVDGPAGGMKIATEQYAQSTTPESVAREVSARECEEMYANLVAPYLPGLGPRCVKAAACLYTATPDFHFLIDRHPLMPNVIVASPCSGHGFKHSAAIGEALAQMALDTPVAMKLDSFSWRRLAHA